MCTFDTETCQPSCPKYTLCMCNYLQSGINSLNRQIMFILETMKTIAITTEHSKKLLEEVDENFQDLTSVTTQFINDSYTNQNYYNNYEESYNEKKNK